MITFKAWTAKYLFLVLCEVVLCDDIRRRPNNEGRPYDG